MHLKKPLDPFLWQCSIGMDKQR